MEGEMTKVIKILVVMSGVAALALFFVVGYLHLDPPECTDPIGAAVLRTLNERHPAWEASSRESLRFKVDGDKDGHLALKFGVSYAGSDDYMLNDIPWPCSQYILEAAQPYINDYVNTVPSEFRK